MGELKVPLFGTGQNPVGKSKKWSLSSYRQKVQQNRRIKKENYVAPAKVKELKGRYRPHLVLVLLVALFFMLDGPVHVGYLLKDISFFKVRSLAVEGCKSASVKQMARLSGITLYKTSLLELNIEAIEQRLAQEPWVRQVEVDRDWPSGVVIEVKEYRPVALMNRMDSGDPELFYVDKRGEPFLKVGPGQDVDYPVITGLDRIAEKELKSEIFSEIMEFLKRASRNNPNLPAQAVSEINVNHKGELVIYLVDHPFPIFFGKGETVTKFYRLLRVMESLYREKQSESLLSGVQYIKMDYFTDKVLVARGSG